MLEKAILDEPPTTDLSKEIKFLDKYLCQYLHNPIVSSAIIVGTCCAINLTQYLKISARSQWELIFVNDYVLDLLQNLINLVFVLRYSMGKFGSVHQEMTLLVLENIGCINLVFNSRYSLLTTNINGLLKAFILWQILCPYFILTINFIDYVNWKFSLQKPRSLVDNNDKMVTFHELLVDTNNNYLPIFIAHSFIILNFNFPFVSNEWLIFVYKIAVFLLKFYCIYRYILYETCVIVYNVSFTNNYCSVYEDVNSSTKQNNIGKWFKDYQHYFILSGIGVCIGFNFLFIGSFYLSVY